MINEVTLKFPDKSEESMKKKQVRLKQLPANSIHALDLGSLLPT